MLKLLTSSHDWRKPLSTNKPKKKKEKMATKTYGVQPLPCPVCHSEPNETPVRLQTIVSCSKTTCNFTVMATSVWSWNESVRAINGILPKVAAPPAPRLTVELGLFEGGRLLKARIVEQTIRGFDFNEECRVKGIDSMLFSDAGPALLATSLYVRGAKEASDHDVVSRLFETKEGAKEFYDSLVKNIRAFNDGEHNGVRDYPEDGVKADGAKTDGVKKEDKTAKKA